MHRLEVKEETGPLLYCTVPTASESSFAVGKMHLAQSAFLYLQRSVVNPHRAKAVLQ